MRFHNRLNYATPGLAKTHADSFNCACQKVGAYESRKEILPKAEKQTRNRNAGARKDDLR